MKRAQSSIAVLEKVDLAAAWIYNNVRTRAFYLWEITRARGAEHAPKCINLKPRN